MRDTQGLQRCKKSMDVFVEYSARSDVQIYRNKICCYYRLDSFLSAKFFLNGLQYEPQTEENWRATRKNSIEFRSAVVLDQHTTFDLPNSVVARPKRVFIYYTSDPATLRGRLHLYRDDGPDSGAVHCHPYWILQN